jgi:hypothetical protein
MAGSEIQPILETARPELVVLAPAVAAIRPEDAAQVTIPRLPDIAWTGLTGRYRDLVSPCTEAPEAFHLGSLLAAVGCLVGRRAWICLPQETYPNLFCLLVGKTAHTRKTTAYGIALKMMEEVRSVLDANVLQLAGIASVEGLAKAMEDHQSTEPCRVLCVQDEFRSLIAKSSQKSVSNIIPRLTELFNCPPTFEVNTKKDPIVVREPFLCLLSATTQAWFEESLSRNDVSGGFLNRWLLFQGETEKLLPLPPPVEKKGWEHLALDIVQAVDEASGHYNLTREAEEFYAEFYKRFRAGNLSEATARTELHATKLGLLYAVLAGHKNIELADIQSGVAVAEYCAGLTEPLAARLGLSSQRSLEERVVGVLQEGPASKRDIYRRLHVSVGELNRVLGPLRDFGKVTGSDDRYELVG